MATFTVPITPTGSARWTQVTSLDGRDFLLSFAWSQRRGVWALDMADGSASPIKSGIAIATNWPLLAGVVDPRRPPGELFLFDLTGNDGSPGFSDLGSRYELVYIDGADLTTVLTGGTLS